MRTWHKGVITGLCLCQVTNPAVHSTLQKVNFGEDELVV